MNTDELIDLYHKDHEYRTGGSQIPLSEEEKEIVKKFRPVVDQLNLPEAIRNFVNNPWMDQPAS